MSSAERVVVTGSSGIAAAVATTLARDDVPVFVISNSPETATELAKNVPVAGWCAADLSVESEAESAFAQADEALSGLTGVVGVAGGSGRRFGDGAMHEISLEGWQRTLDQNLTTSFLTAREALRRMRQRNSGGSIVLTTSALGHSPAPRHFSTHAYAASKSAISGLTVSLAARYAPDGIRVNAVAPGLVETPMSARASADPAILDYVARRQPLSLGMIEAADVASLAVSLLRSPNVTGQVVAVDGGWSVADAADPRSESKTDTP